MTKHLPQQRNPFGDQQAVGSAGHALACFTCPSCKHLSYNRQMCRVTTSLSPQLPGTALQPRQEIRGAQVSQVILSTINQCSWDSMANFVCSTPASPWMNATCGAPCPAPSQLLSTHWALRDDLLLPRAASATCHPKDKACYNLEVFKMKCCIFAAIKFTKCWCFLSAASTKRDVKPHVFIGVLSELLLTEGGSGRRFSKDCWVAERLALTEALVGNFLSWLWKVTRRLVAAFHNVRVEDIFQHFLWEGSVFFSFFQYCHDRTPNWHPQGLLGPHTNEDFQASVSLTGFEL